MSASAVSSAPVVLREASLRDGLQSIQAIVPTAQKIEWLHAAYAAGIREIEAGSFVPARLLPQLADTAEVVASALELEGMTVSTLVPNLKGAVAALESKVHTITIPLSASAMHSEANVRKSPAEMVEEVRRIRELRDSVGSSAKIEGGVGTAFGCTIQGEVPERDVLKLIEDLLNAGVDYISLADTVGFADPATVKTVFDKAFALAGPKLWAAHFHDTRGLGLANVYAAWTAGVRRFDGSLAGIGGCPHAPGASGNVTTEDMASMFEQMGVSTGVNVEAALQLRQRIAGWLPGVPLHGVIWRVPPRSAAAAGAAVTAA
ncbi:hydroxymethylglutaryl-CoA lyase [Variovorax sp. ZT4R33]|uniref:hydroxymethylglutaryl-CoA lyase n=1 Tax=Variovorax sp. ZT4R33 TaxID=3443743 RepID=UPI003F469390